MLTTTALVAFGVAGTGVADTIIDPDGTGATFVFPSSEVLTTGNIEPAELTGSDRLVIGFAGIPGALEVNAENNINGVTMLFGIDFVSIGQLTEGDVGELRVIGDGTANSAVVRADREVRLGSNADSMLVIENGGTVSIGFGETSGSINGRSPFGLLIGSFASFNPGTGSATVSVDGQNSLLDVRGGTISVGGFSGSFEGPELIGRDTLTVTNGADVFARPVDGAAAGDITTSFLARDAIGGAIRVGTSFFEGNGFTDEILVDGEGSLIQYSAGLFFDDGNARVTIQNGGAIRQVEVGTLIDDYASLNANFFGDTAENIASQFGINVRTAFDTAEVIVTGEDSVLHTTRDMRIGGGANGGIETDNTIVTRAYSGEVVVEDGAELTVEGDIWVSDKVSNYGEIDAFDLDNNLVTIDLSQEAQNGSGRMTVASGATVNAGTISVFDGGFLDGDGGTLNANVVLDGGTIAPGASPGIMNILGDLEVIEGLLEIEIAGTAPGMYDQLNVSGNLIAESGLDIEVSFLDGFLPEAGDIFDFLKVDGDAPIFDTPSLIRLSVKGGGAFGTGAVLNFGQGGLSLVSDVADIAPIPVPAGLPMLLTGLTGLWWFGARRQRRRT